MPAPPPPSDPAHAAPDATEPCSRRRFLNVAAGCGAATLGAAVALPPLIATVAPPRPDRPTATDAAWIRLGDVDRFAAGAAPTRIVLRRDERDAWLARERVPFGAVYVERTGDADYRVLSGRCPHLGCGVTWQGEGFACPCHGATFARDGALGPARDGGTNPAPRPLDALEWRLVDDALEVRWQRFRLDTPDKEALG